MNTGNYEESLMAKRPPTDYIKTLISDKTDDIKSAEQDMINNVDLVNAEAQLSESARMSPRAINTMVGRDALTDDDIEMIIIQSKKAAGL